MDFKDRLREAIEKDGRTQTKIADEAGINGGSMSMYLRGQEPLRKNYERLLAVLPSLREEPRP